MVYERKIYPQLLAHLGSPQVTLLTGMRRTGKTTLVRQLMTDAVNKNSLYLDLQRADIRELFELKNYDLIYEDFVSRGLDRNKPMLVVLDELQMATGAPSVIKYLSDHKKVKFVVTGSSSYYLKNLFSESLSGRKKVFELFPLDFGEYLIFKNVSYSQISWQEQKFDKLAFNRLGAYYEDFVRYGGFPQVVLTQAESEKKDMLLDIISSYINIDVTTLADFTDSRNLYSLVKLLAGRVGSRIEYSTLARVVGISRPTVMNYLAFLEKTYLIFTVPVFTKSDDRAIVKARKVYFCDTGLANSLSDLSGGAQFENTVFNQLSRLGELSYYALKSGREIDFVFDRNLALELKETPSEGELENMERLAKVAGIENTRLVGRHASPKFDNYIWGGSLV